MSLPPVADLADGIYLKFKDNGGTGSGQSAVFKGMDNGDFRLISGNFCFNGSVKGNRSRP
jgi:hypothetical protein